MNTEIDYSEVVPAPAVMEQTEWEPPIHKFFGKKLENGKTEKEPLYSYKQFPCLMYASKNGKITARIVKTKEELDSLGDGWSDTPASFGVVTAPSFEQALQAKNETADVVIAEAPRRGRPAKE